MPIAFLTLELSIEAAQSLKTSDKWCAVGKTGSSQQRAIAELDASGLWNGQLSGSFLIHATISMG
jgi:hypothetical protein